VPPPRVELTATELTTSTAEVVAVPVAPGTDGAPPALPPEADRLAAQVGADLAGFVARQSVSGSAGDVAEVPVTSEGTALVRILLVGTGDGSPADLRTAGAAAARRAEGRRHLAVLVPTRTAEAALRGLVEGLLLAAYRFTRARDPKPSRAPVERVTLHEAGGHRQGRGGGSAAAVALAGATAASAHLARDLTNTPSNEKHPAWLARRATELGRRHGLDVRVRDEKELEAGGFGGIAAVGRGSARPPRLVELRYSPDRRGGPHVVLVGKGITFDSGGLSLKPREAMIPMKTDMAGAGAVLGAMSALRDAGVRVRVTALVAAAENMPGASAMRPGDVLRQYGGRTVEVLNTDAEGRLVLADALAYADDRLDPDLVVDIATLTGAASAGLGRRHGALFCADDRLASGLVAAGEASGERLWRMPLVEDYRSALDSEVADLANVSRDPHVSGGAITAALFLREFAGRRRWAHLDIAGPARADRPEREVTKGGTGFGARLLLRWLEGQR
jgi:leucyl aminopeptidase